MGWWWGGCLSHLQFIWFNSKSGIQHQTLLKNRANDDEGSQNHVKLRLHFVSALMVTNVRLRRLGTNNVLRLAFKASFLWIIDDSLESTALNVNSSVLSRETATRKVVDERLEEGGGEWGSPSSIRQLRSTGFYRSAPGSYTSNRDEPRRLGGTLVSHWNVWETFQHVLHTHLQLPLRSKDRHYAPHHWSYIRRRNGEIDSLTFWKLAKVLLCEIPVHRYNAQFVLCCSCDSLMQK